MDHSEALQVSEQRRVEIRGLLESKTPLLAAWVPPRWEREGRDRKALAAQTVSAVDLQIQRLIRQAMDRDRPMPIVPLADTVLLATLACLQVRLMPLGDLGHAFLLPFWDKRRRGHAIVLCVGYKGYAVLAERSGIRQTVSRLVYAGDAYDDALDLEARIKRHRQGPSASTAAPMEAIAGGYVFGVWADGTWTWPLEVNGLTLQDRRAAVLKRNSSSYARDNISAWCRNNLVRQYYGHGEIALGGESYGDTPPVLLAAQYDAAGEAGRLSEMLDGVVATGTQYLQGAKLDDMRELLQEVRDVTAGRDEPPAESDMSPRAVMEREKGDPK